MVSCHLKMIFKTLLQVTSPPRPPSCYSGCYPHFPLPSTRSSCLHSSLPLGCSWATTVPPFPKTRLDWVQTSRNLVSEGFLVYSYVNGNETSSTQATNPWSYYARRLSCHRLVYRRQSGETEKRAGMWNPDNTVCAVSKTQTRDLAIAPGLIWADMEYTDKCKPAHDGQKIPINVSFLTRCTRRNLSPARVR